MKKTSSTCVLPTVSTVDKNIKTSVQTEFCGLRTLASAEGTDMTDCTNFSSDNYPRLSVRKRRKLVSSSAVGGEANAVAVSEKIYVVEGSKLYRCENGGREECAVLNESSDKSIVNCGNDLFILPDHIYYDGISEESKNMRRITNRIRVRLIGKTLTTSDVDLWEFGFRRGDGITVATSPSDMTSFMFHENYKVVTASESTLTVDRNFLYEGDCMVFISFDMPLLTCAMTLGDRMIGASGTVVYLSEKGKTSNWQSSEGVDGDPTSIVSLSEGSFTACAEWNGYPVFFKSGVISKLMGNRASAYSLLEIKAAGVPAWASKTLVNVGGALYYCSTSGVYRYDGSYPKRIDKCTLPDGIRGIAAATDGEKYYLATDMGLFVYDPARDVWYSEHFGNTVGMAGRAGEIYLLSADGRLFGVGESVTGEYEDTVEAVVQFGYDDCKTVEIKSLISIGITYFASEGASLDVYVAFDGDTGVDEHCIGRYVGDGKWHTEICTCPSNRCRGYRLRLNTFGDVTVASVTRKHRVIA